MWQGYIPSHLVDTLASYIQTPGSPLYNQAGIPGQLAAEIDPSYPLAGSAHSTETSSVTVKSNKRRNIIIGVCVGLGGLLWIGLVYWIYRKVKRNHDQQVHRRLSEHMSMYGATGQMTQSGGAAIRHSVASSIAPSEIDDRPSSFYANSAENDPSMRERRRTQATGNSAQSPFADPTRSPVGSSPSGYGSSWFRSSGSHSALGQAGSPSPRDASQNPFADVVHRSYLDHGPAQPSWRRSVQPASKPVNKRLISGPTLQANSLEFVEHR
jgi:hypothetical protein